MQEDVKVRTFVLLVSVFLALLNNATWFLSTLVG